MRPSLVTLLTTIIHLTVVSAQVSLFLPGFDPQPLSADAAGVDEEGRTTWIIQTGAVSGTLDEFGFAGTATLVEGPNDASFTYVAPGQEFTMGFACTFDGDAAVCNDGTDTVTGTIDRIEVQVGTSAVAETPAPSPDVTDTPNGSNPDASTPTTSPSRTNGPSGPSESGEPESSEDDNSGGHGIIPSIAIAVGSAIVGLVMV
ncbi:hypothetical protein AX16_008926 [Volvariella volvacea WC 439]|nr:hypothetical protein AX16_008926 [Volvariella volvacea WC 439]